MRSLAIIALLSLSGCSLLLDSGGAGDPDEEVQDPDAGCSGQDCESPDLLDLPDDFPESILEQYECAGRAFPEPSLVRIYAGQGGQDNLSHPTLIVGEEQIFYREDSELFTAFSAASRGLICPDGPPCFVEAESLEMQLGAYGRRPKISLDGMTLRYVLDDGEQQIYEATRSTVFASAQYGSVTAQSQFLTAPNDLVPPHSDRFPEIYVADGAFVVDGDDEQFYLDALAGDLDQQHGAAPEDFWLSPNGRVMVVSAGGGDDRLYMVAREALLRPWSTPVSLGPTINVPGLNDQEGPWMSADLCVLYFTRKPDGGETSIYRVDRSPLRPGN